MTSAPVASRTRLRVLYVVNDLGPGGTREVVLSQMAALDRSRFEVGLLTLAGDLEDHRDVLPVGMSAISINYPPERSYRAVDYVADGVFLRAARKFGGTALEEIERFAPHILHFHTNPRPLGLGVLVRRRIATELVFTDHVVRIRSDDYSRRARVVLRYAHRRLYRHYHVIAVGPSVARFHRESRLLSAGREHLLLENEVDVMTFHPPSDGRGRPPEVIYVGRIHPVKGVDTLIRAFGRLRGAERVKLTLVGRDEMNRAMHELAAQCVAPPLEVGFLGERGDVPDLLRRATVGVLVSRREGLPLVVLEQMASGLPVVVSDMPELTDLVSHEVNGLVVPVADVEALASALNRLLKDSELRARLGSAARAFVEERLPTSAGTKLSRFYQRIAAAEALGTARAR